MQLCTLEKKKFNTDADPKTVATAAEYIQDVLMEFGGKDGRSRLP